MSYTLEPYKTPSSRHTCPSCGAKRQFARYINIETSDYLAYHVGRCNREQNCAYHYTPKQYFQDHPETNALSFLQREGADGEFFRPNPTFSIPLIFKSPHQKSDIAHPIDFIPPSIFQSSLTNYNHNHFITFLKSIFDLSTVTNLINTYFIGSSKKLAWFNCLLAN